MNPIDPPRLGLPIGNATFKAQPADFEVEEILGFEPSGEGEHCFVHVEKTDRNTNDVATEFAKKLGIRKRLVSHCGLKDRVGITRQWFGLHLPGLASPSEDQLSGDGVKILRITRHLRKLRRGGHQGNRFFIRLRDCDFSTEAAMARWDEITRRGVPNYFGPQRFGRDGRNVEQAKRLSTGEIEIRDRALRGIMISSARSYIFNHCVAARVLANTWDSPMDGEVYGFANNHSLVMPKNLRGDERERVKDGTLEITAPLWGNGELMSEGSVREFELGIAAQSPEITGALAVFNLLQERRVARLTPLSSSMLWETPTMLILKFDLPTGTYATSVLRELVAMHTPGHEDH